MMQIQTRLKGGTVLQQHFADAGDCGSVDKVRSLIFGVADWYQSASTTELKKIYDVNKSEFGQGRVAVFSMFDNF